MTPIFSKASLTTFLFENNITYLNSVSTCNKVYKIRKTVFEQIIESKVFYRIRICTTKSNHHEMNSKLDENWINQSDLNIFSFLKRNSVKFGEI